MDPVGCGLGGIIIHYDMFRPGRDDRGLRVVWQINATFSEPAEELSRVAVSFSDPMITHIVIIDPTPEYARTLGIPAEPKAFLMERGEQRWRVARAWACKIPVDRALP